MITFLVGEGKKTATTMVQKVSTGVFFSGTKTQMTPFPPGKNSKVLDPHHRCKREKDMHENLQKHRIVPFPLIL